MPTIRKPQHVQLNWLDGHLSGQERFVNLKWSADDVVTLTQNPDTVLFSVPARDITRATLTTHYLRLHVGRRSYSLDLRSSTLHWQEGDTEYSYAHREKNQGVPDPTWWVDQLKAAGVPVKVRGPNWTVGVVAASVLVIVVVLGVVAAITTR